MRIAGAQIPVTPDIQRNVSTIKTAIDWAADNNVDYLVTPEAALSGYAIDLDTQIDELSTALTEIEQYAASKKVGLCLGTLWVETYNAQASPPINLKKNQIRYYTKNGQFIGASCKSVMTHLDTKLGIDPHTSLVGVALPVGDDKFIPTAGLICADLYGWGGAQGGLPQQYHDIGVKLFIHATNAERNVDPFKEEIEQIWLEGWLRRMSLLQNCPVVVVDNCFTMDGAEYNGMTMTQSGMLIAGKWVKTVERYGTQYFYYDLPIDDLVLSTIPLA